VKFTLFFLINILTVASLWAQGSLLRCQKIVFSSSIQLTDTLTIAAETIQLPNYPTNGYQILYDNLTNRAQIILKDSIFQDSVLVCYRVFPMLFTATQFRRSLQDYQQGKFTHQYQQAQNSQSTISAPLQTREELFGTSTIQKTGSITRGISVGNTQDVFVNSSLNLQLDGKLTPDLHLTAVISDQNVPYQPEGNTQNIQEFDRILVKLSHKYGTLSAGDVIFKNDSSYFLKYYKNVQGAQAQIHWEAIGKDVRKDTIGWNAQTKVGIAVAKGQFYSTQIPVQDGVLGPYRLSGPDNNRFIIILANSERVFLDGRKLERGFDYDYVIDYNTAEITFMPKILITKFSRVRIDFEFSSQYYTRSIQQVHHRQRIGKKKEMQLNFYREADNPNSPILQQLSRADQEILVDVGDNISQAFSSTLDTITTFSDNQILYTYRDTAVGTQTYRILVRARNTDRPLLRVAFADVGAGRGNYILGSPISNGREYVWVAPNAIAPQGNYEPVRLLIAPNERQITTIGITQNLGENDKIETEWAVSEFDRNLFSPKDNQDNIGQALKIKYTQQKVRLSDNYQLSYGADGEWVQAYFSPIDRFRYIEFDRDWSLDTTIRAPDQILTAFVGLKKNDTTQAEYKVTHRQRGNRITGVQQQFSGKQQIKNIRIHTSFFHMQLGRTDSFATRADWWRFGTDISRRSAKRFIPGYIYQLDQNQIRKIDTDSVVGSAMFFNEQTIYVSNGDSLRFKYRLDYTLREDRSPQNGRIEKNAESETYQFTAQQTHTQFTIRGQGVYRKLRNVNLIGTPTEESVSGRIDYSHYFFQKAIRSELNWQTNSSRELRREFVFVRVENQLGTHTWRDNNSDGIQQLDEFFVAINPDERNYVKFFTPTDQYIQAFNTIINHRLHIDAPLTWAKKREVLRFLSRFSVLSSVQTNSKTTSQTILSRLFPLLGNTQESQLLSDRSVWRNTLFFNRKNPKIGAEWRTLFVQNKQLLTSGFELRYQRENIVSGRWNITQYTNIKQEILQKQTDNRSDFLPSRNFFIREQASESSFSYQPNINTRLTVSYALKDKRNIFSAEGEKLLQHDVGGTVRYSKAGNRSLEANIKRIQMQFSGNVNSAAAYEMLEALATGINYTWNVNYNQRLANGLQISLNYSGRKPENSQVIHIGRVQVTALF